MIHINPSDLALAQQRQLTFSVNVKGKPEQSWSALYKNLELKEAFSKVQACPSEYYELGVFVDTRSGSFKYWSSTCDDLFNSVVLLA